MPCRSPLGPAAALASVAPDHGGLVAEKGAQVDCDEADLVNVAGREEDYVFEGLHRAYDARMKITYMIKGAPLRIFGVTRAILRCHAN